MKAWAELAAAMFLLAVVWLLSLAIGSDPYEDFHR
jgi:hypothetical protein